MKVLLALTLLCLVVQTLGLSIRPPTKPGSCKAGQVWSASTRSLYCSYWQCAQNGYVRNAGGAYCRTQARKPGCACARGKVYDRTTGTCIRYYDCYKRYRKASQQCRRNGGYYTWCTSACTKKCGPRGYQNGYCPTKQLPYYQRTCYPGCQCRRGFVMDTTTQKCIRTRVCDARVVKARKECAAMNAVYNRCGHPLFCQRPCDYTGPARFYPRCRLAAGCFPQCGCRSGDIYDRLTKKCISNKACNLRSTWCPKCKSYNELPVCNRSNANFRRCVKRPLCARGQTLQGCFLGCFPPQCDERTGRRRRIMCRMIAGSWCRPKCVCSKGTWWSAKHSRCVTPAECKAFAAPPVNPFCPTGCTKDQVAVCQSKYPQYRKCVPKPVCDGGRVLVKDYRGCGVPSCGVNGPSPRMYCRRVAGFLGYPTCVCPTGQVYDNISKRCIPAKSCQRCAVNEERVRCVNTKRCRQHVCTTAGEVFRRIACTRICMLGCDCKKDHIWHETQNVCISIANCRAQAAGNNAK